MADSTEPVVPTYQKMLLLMVAYRSVQAVVNIVLGEYKLNVTQWIILSLVDVNPSSLRITDIAKALQVEGPLVTNLAKLLTGRGLLASSAHAKDNRARVLEPTDKGKQLVAELEAQIANRLKTLEKGLNEQQLGDYLKVLETFIDNSASP